jgi:hypothetical protein
VQTQVSDPDALERDHRVTQLREHAADLAILALAKSHLQERTLFGKALDLEFHAGSRAFCKPYPTACLGQIPILNAPSHDN